MMAIYLDATSPQRSSRQPERTWDSVKRSYLPLLQMGFTKLRRYRRTGALLPHRFSFSRTFVREFSFLWHFPSSRLAQPLAGILSREVRTFLTLFNDSALPSGPLCADYYIPLLSL